MLLSLGAKAQQVVKLDLQRTIEIANDSSLSRSEERRVGKEC